MANDPDSGLAKIAAESDLGSIVAPAGYGKTEQIAKATLLRDGRTLILTHTHAGIDVLRARLKKLKVPRGKFRLDTIAGWCLRYATAFPSASGLKYTIPATDGEWNAVYVAATHLLESGAVNSVIAASYSGVFVDEYQDCSGEQHRVIVALSKLLPVCVFGDSLQAIFEFKGQTPVDWLKEVFPAFPKRGELTKPWRWYNTENAALAEWLSKLRLVLEGNAPLDLTGHPDCVEWKSLPGIPQLRSAKIIEVCKSVRGKAADTESVVVIADAASIGVQAYIAKQLAKAGFSKIEPVDCKTLYQAAKKFEKAKGFEQLKETMAFITDCVTGAAMTPFLKAVDARVSGKQLGKAQFGPLVEIGVTFLRNPTAQNRLALLEGFYARDTCYCFRREMYFAMRAALLLCVGRPGLALKEAIRETQTRARHAGRIVPRLSVGSTLLVKGLEFDHAVVVHTEKMTRKDWYVALTRASKSVTLLVPGGKFTPP